MVYLEQVLLLKPENHTCYYNMYKCYVRNDDFDKAYAVLNVFYNEKEVDFSFPLDLLQIIKFLDAEFLTYLKRIG